MTPHVLVEATSAIVLAGQYKPLILPKLTVEPRRPSWPATRSRSGTTRGSKIATAIACPRSCSTSWASGRRSKSARRPTKLLPGKIKSAELPDDPQAAGRDRVGT